MQTPTALRSQLHDTVHTGAREFERRFLSERHDGADGVLEVAVIWRDHISRVDAHPLQRGTRPLTVGAGAAPDAAPGRLQAPCVTYPIELASIGADHTLLEPRDGHWWLRFDPRWEGLLLIADERMTLAQAITAGHTRCVDGLHELPIDGQTRARLCFGDQVFLIHCVPPQALALPPFSLQATRRLIAGMAASLSLLVVALLLAWYTPQGEKLTFSDDTSELSLTTVSFSDAPAEEEAPEEPVELEQLPADTADASEQTARPAYQNGPSLPSPSIGSGGRASGDGSGAASVAGRGLIRNAGQMEALAALGQHTIGHSSAVMSDYAGFNTLPGTGDPWGLTTTTGGQGGPGEGGGSLGADGDDDGIPGGTGKDAPDEICVGCSRARQTLEPTLLPERFDAGGGLSEAIIRRTIREHRRQILACYQTELMKNPRLAGRIEVTWIVDSTGNVSSVRAGRDALNNPAVTRCIERRIRNWRFPQPTNGSRVKVTYPFNFSAR